MKSVKRIKKLISDFNVTTSEKMDKQVREDISEVMRKSKLSKPGKSLPDIRKFVPGSRIIKFAATAVIAVFFSIFIVQFSIRSNNGNIKIAGVTESPAKLTAFGTLSFAYRRGGIGAVEDICDKALRLTGQHPDGMSMDELFEEFNRENSERTKL